MRVECQVPIVATTTLVLDETPDFWESLTLEERAEFMIKHAYVMPDIKTFFGFVAGAEALVHDFRCGVECEN